MAEFQVNIEPFRKDLQKLNFSARRPALVRALIAALQPPLELAEGLAPRDTGQLAGDFVAQEAKSSDWNRIIVVLGVLLRSFYLFFQEYGTAHHPAQPSLGPAMERSIDEINDILADRIQKEINAALL